MKTFVGSIAKEDFPTSDHRDDTTTINVPEKLPVKFCEESIFCTQADRCDGIHCLIGESER